jgi:hypothetical protein
VHSSTRQILPLHPLLLLLFIPKIPDDGGREGGGCPSTKWRGRTVKSATKMSKE